MQAERVLTDHRRFQEALTEPERVQSGLPGCFFEFAPAGRPLNPGMPTLLASELETGRDYHRILSHLGGLYRCAVTDLIRATGWTGRTPRIAYVGRAVERTLGGARLTEPTTVDALTAAATGARIRNATFETAGDRFAVANAGYLPDSFADALDERLGELCPGYRDARNTAVLVPVHLVRVHPRPFLREWERTIRTGQRPTRVKDQVFPTAPGVWDRTVEAMEPAA